MKRKIDRTVQRVQDLATRAEGVGRASASVAVKMRLWEDAPRFAQRDVLRVALEQGLHVGTVHAVHALAHPDRLALVDKRHRWTFEETNRRINQLCDAMVAVVGRGKRPRVVLCMENRVEYALAWFALFRLGWPAVHASDASTAEELKYLFANSGAAVAFGSEKTIANLEKAAPQTTTLVVTGEGSPQSRAIPLERFLDGRSTELYRRQRKVAVQNVVYTSGTTGKPKGAVRDFGSMGIAEMVEILERLPLSPHEEHLVLSKMYHSAGQVFLLIMSALGATVHIHDHFDAADVIRTIHREGITSMFMVPTMISRLLDVDDAVYRETPPSSLKMIVSGAAQFPQPLRERAIDRFGADAIYDFYGASELGWVTLISGSEMLARPGSQGRALSGQAIRVVDGQNQCVPPREVGLVQVRTHSKMEGYLGDVNASREVESGDGWMTVDDTGFLDEDGYLYIVGRARDMIISGGVNIYPVEIEDVIARHPAILDIAVVGAPDPEWGEKIVACVVVTPDFEPDDVQRWARELLTSYKIPRTWFVLDELPRNATGKVVKRTLQEMYAAYEAGQSAAAEEPVVAPAPESAPESPPEAVAAEPVAAPAVALDETPVAAAAAVEVVAVEALEASGHDSEKSEASKPSARANGAPKNGKKKTPARGGKSRKGR